MAPLQELARSSLASQTKLPFLHRSQASSGNTVSCRASAGLHPPCVARSRQLPAYILKIGHRCNSSWSAQRWFIEKCPSNLDASYFCGKSGDPKRCTPACHAAENCDSHAASEAENPELSDFSQPLASSAFLRRSILGGTALAFSSTLVLSSCPLPLFADTGEALDSPPVPSLQSEKAEARSPQQLASLPALPPGSTVSLSILGDCVLGVSVYPDFSYNPLGGGGFGTAVDTGDGKVAIKFDPKTLRIPAVEGGTTKLLGVPLPPPIRIDILPESLEGILDRATGQVNLNFKAKFFFSTGPLYHPPPLLVDTLLTTGFSKGTSRSGQGASLDDQNRCRLVGTARVPPINDAFLDNFLMLPTDVLAALPAQFTFSPAIGTTASAKVNAATELAWANGQYDLVHKLAV